MRRGGLVTSFQSASRDLTVHGLRRIALAITSPDELAVTSQHDGDSSMTVEEYIANMDGETWGDNLMLALLARCFGKPISVMWTDMQRSWYPDGREVNGVSDGASLTGIFDRIPLVRRESKQPRRRARTASPSLGGKRGVRSYVAPAPAQDTWHTTCCACSTRGTVAGRTPEGFRENETFLIGKGECMTQTSCCHHPRCANTVVW